MDKIRIGIIGVGNCASSLLQGMEYYSHKTEKDAIGLMHWSIGGYLPSDIVVAAAFDIDKRKVGRDVNVTGKLVGTSFVATALTTKCPSKYTSTQSA